jgi:hypothetical protein
MKTKKNSIVPNNSFTEFLLSVCAKIAHTAEDFSVVQKEGER